MVAMKQNKKKQPTKKQPTKKQFIGVLKKVARKKPVAPDKKSTLK